MKSFEIFINDWNRIFIGNVPVVFILEAILRFFFVYLILVISMRLLGQRMSSQLSQVEMVSIVSLAAAIGVPVLAPDRGLLPAVIIAAIVVYASRMMAKYTFRRRKVERVLHGNVDVLVKDGVMQVDTMKKSRITFERVMSQLRSEGIRSLGEVSRLYIEASGDFTVVKNESPAPGLSTIPGWHRKMQERQQTVADRLACTHCGNLRSTADNDQICVGCDGDSWAPAVLQKA